MSSTYKFSKPPVGAVIDVTTRYIETYYYADSKWRDNTRRGVQVLDPEKWFGPDDFKITSDDPKMPYRVINLNQVVDLVINDDEGVSRSVDHDNFSIQVKGSKGNSYTVTFVEGTAVSCTCPGFSFRSHCRHLAQAAESVDVGSQTMDNVPVNSEPYSATTHKRGNDIMSQSKALSWNDRFALIDHYQPTDDKTCEVFGVTQDELDAARNMREANSFAPTQDLDVDAYRSWFDDQSSESTGGASKSSSTKSSTSKSTSKKNSGGKGSSKSSTSKSGTKTSTKKSGGKQTSSTKKGGTATSQKKPGRRGSKIATAFQSIPTTPTPAEQFADSNSVSLAVLRQSKRFDRYPEKGTVRVKKDKDKGQLMIWREAPESND